MATPTNEELREAIANAVPLAQSGVSIVLVPTERLDQIERAIRSLELLAGSQPGGGDGTVIGVPPPPKIPASQAGRVVTAVVTYSDLAVWDLGDSLRGELAQITFTSDKPANALFRLEIAGKEQWVDLLFLNALSVDMAGLPNQLPPNTKVVLQVRTNNIAQTVTANGEISGTEQAVKQ